MISKNIKAYALLISILIFAGVTSALWAQDMSLNDLRMRQEFKVLQQKIESAKQLLANNRNDRILTLIREAERKKDEAFKFWRDKKMAKARAAIKAGLKNINTALALLLRDPLQLQQKQLAVLLERLERFPNRARMKDAEMLYRKAKEKESLAKKAAGNGDLAKALELLRLGITFADKALAVFERNQVPQVEQSRFIETAARVRDAVDASNNAAARRVYEQAMRQGKNAADAYHDGHMAASAGLYTEGMKLLLRAFDLASVGRTLNEHDLRVELQTVEDLLQTAQSKLGNQPSRGIRLMLNRARKSMLRAANALENRNYQTAKAQLKFSRGILNKLFRQNIGRPGRARDRTVIELQRLRSAIDELTARLGADKPAAQGFLRTAGRGAKDAERALANGNYNLALNRILVARRFLTKTETAAQSGQTLISESVASAQIRLLEQSLQQNEALESGNRLVKSLLNEAGRMYVQAEQKLSDQQFALAFELADVGLELIKKALRAARNR